MSTLHEKTRKIYEAQHARLAADAVAKERILGMYDNATFGVDAAWFKGKEALDAGCGNVGGLIKRLSQLEVKKVYGIDIGSDWIEKMRHALDTAGVSKDRYDIRPGSVLEMPFEDGKFDFTAINGVLIHLSNMTEVLRGFREGARVTKKGGWYFTSYGPCGGLIQGAIFPAVRQYYRENEAFKAFIDEVSSAKIHVVIDKIKADAKKHTGEEIPAEFLKSLFGEDFCVFLQNFIQAPVWMSNECTPEFVEEMYKANGFTNIKRLGSYVKRSDIRKFFAPLHYDRENEISKVLYGKGYVQYVGQKA